MEGLGHSTPGTVVLLLAVLLLLFREILRIKAGHHHDIRRIPGIDAVESTIGRCAELGRPVVFTTGLTSVGPVLYACLGVLHAAAKRVAQYKLKLFIPQYQPDAMAIVEDVARDAYNQVGRASSFEPQNIQFLSDEQFAFASGYQGLVNREKVGAAFMFGSFAAEALVLAEAGQQVGARQVAASVSPEQVAFFICTCDYTLIGEELFGASAYLSRDVTQVATLAAQDRMKLGFLLLIVLGVIVATYNQVVPPHKVIPTPDRLFYLSWSGV
jgi:hypothetical protein